MSEIPNILAYCGGGLGDQVCAEPALRYALNQFKGQIDISILSHSPWLYSHLNFKEVFTVQGPKPDFSKYVMRGTYPLLQPGDEQKETEMTSFCSVHTNGVDYSSLQLLKWQLPIKDREINLVGEFPEKEKHKGQASDPLVALKHGSVLIHPGISWQSKTFPIEWWKEVVDGISRLGARPVLIGQKCDQNGVHEITGTNAVNLVGRLNLKELIYLLQRCTVLITNDSLPLHIAASREPNGDGGDAWIGFISTAKHPDFLLHSRKGGFGWQMENLAKGGLWARTGIQLDAKSCTEQEMKSFLPLPGTVARWAVMKTRE